MILNQTEYNKIDGFYYAQIIKKKIQFFTKQLREEYNINPCITIVLVGKNLASEIYVRNKIKIAIDLGILANVIRFDEDISETNLLAEIDKINNDKNIHGVIVQLPLPKHIDKNKILLSIFPQKDIDGLHPFNSGLLTSNSYVPYTISEIIAYNTINNEFIEKFKNIGKTLPFIPCTPLGCLYLIEETLKKTQDGLVGKNVVILGNSNLVSKPMARILLQSGATTTTLHSKSVDCDYFIKNADIIVSATGKQQDLTNIKKNAILIDVGIRQKENEPNKITGDLNFEKIIKTNKITPVPKGVGPMTVVSLMVNAVLASIKQLSNS